MKMHFHKPQFLIITLVTAVMFLAGCGPKDNSDYWRSQLKKAKSPEQKIEYRLLLAQALDTEKRYDESIKEYDAVIATKSKKHLFMALNNKGRALFNFGKNEEALVIFDQLLKMDHEKKFDTVLYSNVAMCLHKMKQFDKALVAYNKAIELKPDNKEAIVGLGYLKQDMQLLAAEVAKNKKAQAATSTLETPATSTGAGEGDKTAPVNTPEKSGN